MSVALPETVRTLPELFQWRVAASPRAEAYREFDPEAGEWVSASWQQIGDQVARWTAALARFALPRGARIAILLPNGMRAVCIDQAALALGCVPVPLHALDNPASIAYILSDSGASVLVAATEAQWRAIDAVGVALPELRQVVVAQAADSQQGSGVPVVGLQDWLSPPNLTLAVPMQAPEAHDLAALVYTSGTTGKPKGVILTHSNVVSNVRAVLATVAPVAGDVFLSFLPLSHTFERTAGYYLPMAAGACVVYARSVSLLADDLKIVRPTILISVPRIYERVHAKVQETLAGSVLKARLFGWAEAVGWRRFCRQQGLPREGRVPGVLDDLAWLLLAPLVARPLLKQFGGRLRAAVSGGAPLSKPLAHCFLGLGLPLLQGYGMTETSPVVAANAPRDNDPATVGRPVPGVEVRIGDNLELQVRGPNVMRGYWKREQDTARAFVEGWLRTGDQAAIEGGRVHILGRVKEIIVTSTGEKVAPVDLELAIMADPLFEQAYVFGDNRPFIACIVVLGMKAWKRLAATLGLDAAAPASLEDGAARAMALERIHALTGGFPHYAQPRAVALTLQPWTIDNGLMTPTLKLKRNNLTARFGTVMESLYRR
ncbi:long-chain fatty acid--CoA ligase [Aquabacterium sp. A7-Y]|uniref:AMP-dependent synthetase/ligase n=1 Tax=Aquabacterium sp. A7-Y TaxID=1349605 RepID=UPI00223DC2BC|nr:long-chain fatty acid--CoA ligase [Aquabacterium sp. A7-Y]MCW7541184.1 long-chain fatty acid--CoA ligase [Aquabacterium sp. A7-Y]